MGEAAGGRDDLRAVPVESLHVTLAFLGHVSVRDAERAGALVRDLAPSCAAAALEPGAITAVPRRRPRLFALDLADPSGAVSRFQDALAGALAVEGIYEPEERAFWPHVTVARVRRGRTAEPLGPPPALDGFSAGTVTLYRSRPGKGGSVYEPLESADLSG